MNNQEKLISVLESSWDKGFFFQLRAGVLNLEEFKNVRMALEAYEDDLDVNISKHLVSLLWCCPTFIDWQKPNLMKRGYSKLDIDKVQVYFQNKCQDILGMP